MKNKQFATLVLVLIQFLFVASSSMAASHNSIYVQYQPTDETGPVITGFYLESGSSFRREYSDSVYLSITDEDGIDQVWCYYGKNGSADFTNVSMHYSSGVDAYTCSISGYLDSAETLWFFQFYANDTHGARTTYNYSCYIYYNQPDPEFPPYPWLAVGILFTAISISIIAIISAGWWYKKRR